MMIKEKAPESDLYNSFLSSWCLRENEIIDKESVFSLEGDKLEGDIPPNKKKLVEAWIEIHKEDLQANWKLLDEGEQSFKIEPLK